MQFADHQLRRGDTDIIVTQYRTRYSRPQGIVGAATMPRALVESAPVNFRAARQCASPLAFTDEIIAQVDCFVSSVPYSSLRNTRAKSIHCAGVANHRQR
ncbi:MAG: hypothetical protein ACTHNN_16050 [Xanthobacteraceae bacterium]